MSEIEKMILEILDEYHRIKSMSFDDETKASLFRGYLQRVAGIDSEHIDAMCVGFQVMEGDRP